MGEEGFALVDVGTLLKFLVSTNASRNLDGSIRHYHCLISPGPKPELYWSKSAFRADLSTGYYSA